MVTAAMKLKDAWLLGSKAIINLEIILKSRDLTLLTNICLIKAMIFPVVMYGCESQTIKKAECRKIDAFELWYRRRLLRVPQTAGISNPSILKEISPEYSLEGLVLKLKLQYLGHLIQRSPRADLLQNGLVGSPCSPRDSQEKNAIKQSFRNIVQQNSCINLISCYSSFIEKILLRFLPSEKEFCSYEQSVNKFNINITNQI